jgi:hypothetical protein
MASKFAVPNTPKQPSGPPPAGVMAKKRPRVVEPPTWMVVGVPPPPPPPVRADRAQTLLCTEPKSAGCIKGEKGWDAGEHTHGRRSVEEGQSVRRLKKQEKVESDSEEIMMVVHGVPLPMTPPTPPMGSSSHVEPVVEKTRAVPDYVEPEVDVMRAEAIIHHHKLMHKELSGDRIQRGGWQSKAQVLIDLVTNGLHDDAVLVASHYGKKMDEETMAEVVRRAAQHSG